jgi:hypothetical protein
VILAWLRGIIADFFGNTDFFWNTDGDQLHRLHGFIWNTDENGFHQLHVLFWADGWRRIVWTCLTAASLHESHWDMYHILHYPVTPAAPPCWASVVSAKPPHPVASIKYPVPSIPSLSTINYPLSIISLTHPSSHSQPRSRFVPQRHHRGSGYCPHRLPQLLVLRWHAVGYCPHRSLRHWHFRFASQNF